MNKIIIYIISLFFLIMSCKKKNKIDISKKNYVFDTIILKNKNHLRSVNIEQDKLKKDNLINNFSFLLVTKDTITKNRFTDENISTELIKDVKIFKNKKQVQVIKNINEEIFFSIEKKKLGSIKLEDRNNDGFLDLWIEFSPFSSDYDSDYIIFLFDQKRAMFSNKREYLVKNLTEEEFKKRFGPSPE